MKAPLLRVSWQLFFFFTINSWSFSPGTSFHLSLKIWCSQGAQLFVFLYTSPGGDWTYFCPSNSLSSSLSHCYRDQSHSRAAQHHLTCLTPVFLYVATRCESPSVWPAFYEILKLFSPPSICCRVTPFWSTPLPACSLVVSSYFISAPATRYGYCVCCLYYN